MFNFDLCKIFLILTDLGKFAKLGKFGRKIRRIMQICRICQLSLSLKKTQICSVVTFNVKFVCC